MNPFRACAGVCGGHANGASDATFTLRPATVMLVTETMISLGPARIFRAIIRMSPLPLVWKDKEQLLQIT